MTYAAQHHERKRRYRAPLPPTEVISLNNNPTHSARQVQEDSQGHPIWAFWADGGVPVVAAGVSGVVVLGEQPGIRRQLPWPVLGIAGAMGVRYRPENCLDVIFEPDE